MSANERSPTTGRLTGWRPGADGGDPAALSGLLATGDLTIEGRLPWSSNMTFLVTVAPALPGPGAASQDGLLAVYKPVRGERPLWDYPGGLHRREVAAYVLSEHLGWDIVPPTVLREDGPFGPGSLQLFVDADFEQHYFTIRDAGSDDPVLRTICAFDIVANNADRKSGHVLAGSTGRLWAIDHGLCFHPSHKLRTVIWDFAGDPLPDPVGSDLRRLCSGPPAPLDGLLGEIELEAMQERAVTLLGHGTYPEPVGERPPYPWPLI